MTSLTIDLTLTEDGVEFVDRIVFTEVETSAMLALGIDTFVAKLSDKIRNRLVEAQKAGVDIESTSNKEKDVRSMRYTNKTTPQLNY